MATSGRKKTRSTNRGWWWEEFTEHPGYESSEPAAMVRQKAKVICTRQLKHYVAAEQARDEHENMTSEVNQSAESSCVTVEDDADAFVDPQQTSSEVHGHRGLQQIAAQLIQAVEDEESFTTSEIMEAVTNPSDFQQIPIKDLFDFSHAQDWLGSFYQTAIRGLDAEIELYELLDLDAVGIDDPEFPHADEILDE
ncbi:hypothetical protein BDR03DRAFT_1024683 [Suillus americanus]|nr:hypothetical protein BDR03DRAFT_1024683 [Suillus americanus]